MGISPAQVRRAAGFAAVAVVSLLVLGWSLRHSGFLELFRGPLPDDPQHLRGKSLALHGQDSFRKGYPLELDDFRGQHVLVVRAERRYTAWLLGALKRWWKDSPREVVLLSVARDGQEDPPDWVLQSGLPFRGVTVDGETMREWGFDGMARAELRLIDRDGRVATVDLAGEDRDDTILALNKALIAAGVPQK